MKFKLNFQSKTFPINDSVLPFYQFYRKYSQAVYFILDDYPCQSHTSSKFLMHQLALLTITQSQQLITKLTKSLITKINSYLKVAVVPGTFKLKDSLSEWKRRIKNTDISYPSLFYRIQGLAPNAYYQLEIQALNDVGWSIPNGMFIFRTNFGEIVNFTSNLLTCTKCIRALFGGAGRVATCHVTTGAFYHCMQLSGLHWNTLHIINAFIVTAIQNFHSDKSKAYWIVPQMLYKIYANTPNKIWPAYQLLLQIHYKIHTIITKMHQVTLELHT